MSYFTILCFKRSTISTKYWLEKCLRRYLMYHARVYSTGVSNHHKNCVAKKDRATRRKALKLQVLQDIKLTKRKVEEIIEKENIWTVPNFLCIGRILTSPYISYLILSQDYQVKLLQYLYRSFLFIIFFNSYLFVLQVALWLLIIAGFSDLADGWIARTWTSQASKLGSFLDPVADKLLVGTLFLSLACVGLVPIPLTCLVVSRDVALVSAASYIRYRSLPPPVCMHHRITIGQILK